MVEGAIGAVRTAKWIAIVVGGLLLLLAAAVFVATSVIDPNRYRGRIQAIVTDLTGRPFVIDGNLEITWYPWLGVRMGPARLAGGEAPLARLPAAGGVAPTGTAPPVGGASPHAGPAPSAGTPAPPLLEWQSMSVAAKLLPLLKGELVVDRIRLESPHIRLRRHADGHGNWEGLGPATGTPAAGTRPAGPAASPATTTKPPPQIAGLEIRNGVLDYDDDQTGLHVTLSDLEFEMGEWREGQPLPVHTRFVVHHDSLPAKGIPVELTAKELHALLTPTVSVRTPAATLLIADAKIESDFAYEQTSAPSAAPTSAPSSAPTPAPSVTAHASTTIHAPSLRTLAADLSLNQTLPHDPTTLGPLDMTTTWTYNNGAIQAKPITLKLDGVNFTGWIERSAPPEKEWRFELHGDQIDLTRYVKVDTTSKRPFELPVDALRSFNANGTLIFDQALLANARLSDVRLKFQTPETKQ